MIYTGIVSVTFRKKTPKEIIELTKRAGLDGIEWGGDVHVPHGDTKLAREVRKMTEDSGLKVASYGSYHRIGTENDGVSAFKRVIDSAKELDAPVIRVWAGNKASEVADDEWWDKCVKESYDIAELAWEYGIKVAYEYHNNTLTDTSKSAVKLLERVNHANMRSYWQPLKTMTVEERISSLKDILPWLENVHVHHVSEAGRQPLKDGKENWVEYFKVIKELKEDRFAMIEFVMGETDEQFIEDARALKEFIELA
ncbi:MAG TPA: sugar phosphate isomerase/epimerase [Clostridiaceae bacterium]|jgi:3-dehydroshikimate dehydratase|nr:sugar phosphate isomerase/epimerase [Clostridiaceae bacterium]